MIAENILNFSEISSVPQMLLNAFEGHNKRDALNFRDAKNWVAIAAETIVERVRHVALGLAEMGIKSGDRVALIAENRPEWSIADLAILSLRAVNVPIYTTQSPEQVRYILEDSGARMLFISGKKIYKHIAQAIEGIEPLEKLIFFDDDSPEENEQTLILASIEQRGAEIDRKDPQAFKVLLEEISANDLATIIYTSGTTGEPKGVMLSHDAFISNVEAISKTLPIFPTDISIAVLPLSHIFERTCFYVMACCGVSVHYAANFDHLAEYLQEVRPTVMTSVPRLFEKVYHKIVRKSLAAGGLKTKLAVWAMEIGQKYAAAKDKHQTISPWLAGQHALASRLVFSKWREAVGGRLRYFVSGGAPLSSKISYAFSSAGIPILQGYGMTEGCVTSANRPDDIRFGSIGKPFEGIEVKIADDGEILIKGRCVMQGYYNKPELTDEVLKDGWYHTGDVGHIADNGHIYITDRKKDLFKLSNGKYIAPLQVESLIKQSPFVNQAVAVGSGRKQTGALIVPDWEALKVAMAENGLSITGTREEISKRSEVVKLVQKDIVAATKELSDYERVKKVALLPNEFSIDKGEMTPTLKVKRTVIDEKYKELIDEICGGGTD